MVGLEVASASFNVCLPHSRHRPDRFYERFVMELVPFSIAKRNALRTSGICLSRSTSHCALFSPSPSSSVCSLFYFLLNFLRRSPHICVFGASFLNDDCKDRGGIRAVVLGAANRRVGRNRKEREPTRESRGT